jgi:uncharacterized protein
MFYLDASLIVTFLTPEPANARVRIWLEGHEMGTLFISPWVSTEVASALSIKRRVGDLTAEMRASAKNAYERFVARSLTQLAVVDRNFALAAEYAEMAELGLRAGDALHLAISQTHGLTLATLDKRLAESGPQFGAATLLL